MNIIKIKKQIFEALQGDVLVKSSQSISFSLIRVGTLKKLYLTSSYIDIPSDEILELDCFSVNNIPTQIFIGQVKIRLIFENIGRVVTTSIMTDDSHLRDGLLREMYPELPAPKVFEIHDEYIEEEYIDDPRKKNIISSVHNNLNALRILLKSTNKYNRTQGEKIKSVIHGQLYKADHILINNDQVYLVDWSEGGDKDDQGYGDAFFDIASSIKWVLVKKRWSWFYLFCYLQNYLELAEDLIEKNSKEWKRFFRPCIQSIFDDSGKFSESSLQVKYVMFMIDKYKSRSDV